MSDVICLVHNTMPGIPLELEEEWDGLTFKKELIYIGDFTKKTKDEEITFSVDEAKIAHWCHTGNRMIQNGVKVPLPLKHTDNPEANRAKVIRYETGVNDRGLPALFGIVRFNNEKAAELAASTDVSIYVPAETFTDGVGNQYPYVIKHVALTDYPVIPGLSDFQAIAASYESEEDTKDLLLSRFPTLAKIAKHPVTPLIGVHAADAVMQARHEAGLHATTRKGHLAEAAVHGGIGVFAYKEAKHIGKTLGRFTTRQAGKGLVKNGIMGMAARAGRIALRSGVKTSLKRYALPALVGYGAVHSALHGGINAIKSSKKAVTLSLNYNSNEPRDKHGRWARLGRAIAAAGIAGAATDKIVRGIGGPLAIKGSRNLLKYAGGAVKPLSKADKIGIAVESAGNIAHGAVLGKLAKRVINEPSRSVTPESKARHKAKAIGHGVLGAWIAANGIDNVANAIKHASTTGKIASIVEHSAKSGMSRKSKIGVRAVGHGFGTRPAAALAVGSAAAAGGLMYAAHRALRKMKMHNKAAKEIHASFGLPALELGRKKLTDHEREKLRNTIRPLNDPSRPHIHGINGLGHFVRKTGGHSTSREIRRLNTHSPLRIHDASSEDVMKGDRLTHALQVGKHAALGVGEAGLLGGAIAYLGKGAIHSIRAIGKTKLHGAASHKARLSHIKSLAGKFAGAAAASGLLYNRLDAIKTHFRKATGKN